jgi:hypothetical protein
MFGYHNLQSGVVHAKLSWSALQEEDKETTKDWEIIGWLQPSASGWPA